MRNKYLFIIIPVMALAAGTMLFTDLFHTRQNINSLIISNKEEGLPPCLFLPELYKLQIDKTKDPVTGKIPAGIRSRELEFARDLPVKNISVDQSWNWRGPDNLGGRMLCVAVDVENEEHLLAGSASGGMWQSLNGGQSWSKVTSPDDEQSATCIIQDPRPGKHSTWYYGTGEILSTTDRNVSTNVRTIGIGDGIFKSTDNGQTWQALPFTQCDSPGSLSEIFQGVWRIVVDPVSLDKDIVYAACYGAIMRSENGGQTWEVVLGDLANKSFCTDIVVTSEAVLYTLLSKYGYGLEPPGKAGIWRSADGLDWSKITPSGFPDDNRSSRLALAPSNQDIMYVFTESQSPDLNPFNGYANSINTFWKMTWSVAADSAVWENRTAGIPGEGSGSINDFPFSFVCYGGYAVTMAVKPDDENTVILGGMNLFRSENGFATHSGTRYMGGYPYDMADSLALHPDMHGLAFYPSNPSKMLVACDGGIQATPNCVADSATIEWKRLNNKLTSSQFYSVAIDHSSISEDWILGGLQDNAWYYTVTDDPSELWFCVDICYDGFATAVAPGWEYAVISAYSGNIWTSRFDAEMHTKNIFSQLPDTLLKFWDPAMGSNSLFPFYQNFALDPNDPEIFYLPTVTSIWRKDNLRSSAIDSSLRNTGWSHLSNVDVGDAAEISYITVSKEPPNRLYFGTSLGKVYRLDDANTGTPAPVDITGPDFPPNAFVACIDVKETNADHMTVVFSNYNVRSIFTSLDGGSSWTPQGGNLEQFPDGSGNGPSIRFFKSLDYNGQKVWFAGTSVGLFSTTSLGGDATVWTREGSQTIGSLIIDMIDARQADGFVAVATHGNGVYSAYYTTSSVAENLQNKTPLQIGEPFPNPAKDHCQVEISSRQRMMLEVKLYDISGNAMGSLFRDEIVPGKGTYEFNLGNPDPGVYLMYFVTSEGTLVKRILAGL
jgi:photosystem II stability/assembly factor-like uncharacterized protein